MAYVVARINSALDAANSGITHARLHTGDPGSAGTDNVAAGVAAAELTGVGSAAGGSDTFTGAWTIPGAGGPFTHFSLWAGDPGSAGTVAASGVDQTLTPAEEFAGAGTLNVTITSSGS